MFSIDWSAAVDELVRVGLAFGAIFQLICIAAAIFLPCKSDTPPESASSVNRKSGQKSADMANDRFLVESDESEDEVAVATTNRRRRAETAGNQLHQRHGHQLHEEPRMKTASKRHEKKKRR